MRHDVASELSRRFLRLAAVALVNPKDPPLSTSRDFNEEDRLAKLHAELEVVRPAMDTYLSAVLGASTNDYICELARTLDSFYDAHCSDSRVRGDHFFLRALAFV